MLIFGGLVGLVVGLPAVAIPMGVALAALLGVTVVLPPVAPLFAAPLGVVLIVHAVIVLIFYFVALFAQPLPAGGGGATPVSLGEQFCRGCMVGLNTACNFVVLLVVAPVTLIFAPLVDVLAVVIAVLNFLAVFPLATNAFYEGTLGWFSLAMPMAWPGSLLGLVWWVCNFFGMFFFPSHLFTDWPTGGFVVEGSITGVLTGGSPTIAGYNLGNFSFITPVTAPRALLPQSLNLTSEGVLMHEAGHALSNAALGPWFGIGTALDNVIRALFGQTLRQSYGEMIAESHSRSSSLPWVECWAPYVGPSGAATSNAPPTGSLVCANPALNFPLGTPLTVIAIASGATMTLDVSNVTDPDNYLLGDLTPPAGAPLVLFWDLPPNPHVTIDSTSAPVMTATAASGGDAPLLAFRVTDGIEGKLVALILAVVEAHPNGPYTGTVNQAIALTAAGTTAGTAGALPSAATGTVPALTLQWTTTQAVAGSTPVLLNPTAEAPTFSADRAGPYQVTLTVTTIGGVSHSATAAIDITP